MLDLKSLFKKSEFVPAVITDDETGEVLMLAYMSEQSLKLTIQEGRTVFWSRSRNELWRKGESSGHIQEVVSITADCDMDTILIKVKQTGVACHTGAKSCFFNKIWSKK